MQMQHILVTGGAGFLGVHLVERLLHDGHRVTCLDNLQTGKQAHVDRFADNKNYTFVQADIIDPLPDDLDVQQIFHLACPASPEHYQADPIHTYRTSVWGAWNLLIHAEKVGARLLFASTSEVYGDPEMHPQNESYWGHVNPIGIRSCYDEGKRGAETLATDFVRAGRADVRIARIFNTYGPCMSINDGRVVSNFVVQAIRGESVTVYGDGGQTRSFCYVSDLVEGLVRLMAYDGDDAHKPCNLGNPNEFSIEQLVDELSVIAKNELGKKYLPLPSDDPTRRQPDITRAKSILGWEPQVQLTEGLAKTYAWFATELTGNAG